MRLQACHSRHQLPNTVTHFVCSHPRVRTKGDVVSRGFCRSCKLWSEPPPEKPRSIRPPPFFVSNGPCFYLGEHSGFKECKGCRGNVKLKLFHCSHPMHSSITLADCVHCQDFHPELVKGSLDTWSVGVNAFQSNTDELARCLSSLEKAGWTDSRVFVAKNSEIIPEGNNFQLSCFDNVSGERTFWLLSLAEMMLRNPFASAYLLVQPDVVFCKNARAFLEHDLWPAGRVGFISLSGPLQSIKIQEEVSLRKGGWDSVGVLDEKMPAVDAVVLPNPAARSLLAHATMRPSHEDEKNSTGSLTRFLRDWGKANGFSVDHYVKSLARSLNGNASTLQSTQDSESIQSDLFVGEDFDASRLIKESEMLSENT